MVEAVDMLKELYGAVVGELDMGEEEFAVLDPVVPALICGIVWDLNERKRNESAGEWFVTNPSPETDGMYLRLASCGCGRGREHGLCCGAH